MSTDTVLARLSAVRYVALATDYDGTIARHGKVDRPTMEALERLKESGRRLILVTGRELPDLLHAFDRADLFDRIVAENGAVVYDPVERTETVLADPPNPAFVEQLRRLGVQPLSVGRVIVATWEPHQTTVLEAIRNLGLELQVIFNKGAVMVLPSGINKAAGLAAALQGLGLSPLNVAGVGDAENDHAFLTTCACGAAVANALPMLKERADIVLAGDHGAGVIELIDQMIESDLQSIDRAMSRHDVIIGSRDRDLVRIRPWDTSVLVAGPSGSGKSTLATAFLEGLADRQHQICVMDPEGDYERLNLGVCIGGDAKEPTVDEILGLLSNPSQSVVINLLAVPLADRPTYFATLLPRLQELRSRTGRPHWIVVDEAHHLLPTESRKAEATLPQILKGFFLITVHPESVFGGALRDVDHVFATGPEPQEVIAAFARAAGAEAPPTIPAPPDEGEALYWRRPDVVIAMQPGTPRAERLRHRRKYAEGHLGADKSFFFTGPDGALNLRADNLILFLQLAEGVDEATWLHHLQRGDYSRWFRHSIKDEDLAEETAAIEHTPGIDAHRSLERVRDAIQRRYTLPSR